MPAASTHTRPPARTSGRALCACATLLLLTVACRGAPAPGGQADGPPPEPQTTAALAVSEDVAGEPGAPPGAQTAPSSVLSEAAALATARIQSLLPDLETAWGTPGSDDGQLMLPFGVAVDTEGNVYVSDSTGAQKFTADGQFVVRFGVDDLLTALGGIAVDETGLVYVTGFGPAIHVFAPDGSRAATIGQPGGGAGQLAKPVDVAVDARGDLFVADAQNGRVEKFARDGTHLLTIGEPGEGRGQFRTPRAVAVDDSGNIYVGQGDDYLIQRFAPDGSYLDTFGDAHADENVWRVGGLAVDERGNVYATQAMASHVQSYRPAPDTGLAWELGGLGASPGKFATPLGLAYRDGRLYVVDQQNNRIQVFRLKQ